MPKIGKTKISKKQKNPQIMGTLQERTCAGCKEVWNRKYDTKRHWETSCKENPNKQNIDCPLKDLEGNGCDNNKDKGFSRGDALPKHLKAEKGHNLKDQDRINELVALAKEAMPQAKSRTSSDSNFLFRPDNDDILSVGGIEWGEGDNTSSQALTPAKFEDYAPQPQALQYGHFGMPSVRDTQTDQTSTGLSTAQLKRFTTIAQQKDVQEGKRSLPPQPIQQPILQRNLSTLEDTLATTRLHDGTYLSLEMQQLFSTMFPKNSGQQNP